MTKLSRGQEFEGDAISFLEQKGYQIIDRNWYCKYGEIDLIMKDKDFIVFVEVKSLSSKSAFYIYESLNKKKLRRLKSTINSWIYKNNYKGIWRLDFVGITYDKKVTLEIYHEYNILL